MTYDRPMAGVFSFPEAESLIMIGIYQRFFDEESVSTSSIL
jgi:hypothetical protein